MHEQNIKVKLSLAQRKVICQLMPVLYLRLRLITPSQRVIPFALRELETIHRRAIELKDHPENAMHRKLRCRVMEIVAKAIEGAKEIDSRSV